MSLWFYADRSNQRHGPLGTDQIKALHANGTIDASTLVWRDGLPQWLEFRAVAAEIDPDSATLKTATTVPVAAGPSAACAHVSDGGGDVVYAGFWRRVAAYFMDSLVLGMLSMVIQAPLFVSIGMASGGQQTEPSAGMVIALVAAYLIPLTMQAVYYAWCHSSPRQATLGKGLVGIKVTGLNGERISFKRGFGRYCAMLLSGLTLCVGFLMAGFTDRRQCLHDMLASTLVVDQYAFTATPERQERGLGTAAKAILAGAGALYGLMLLIVIVLCISLVRRGA